MIRHVVLFKVSKEHQDEIPTMIEKGRAMRAKIPFLADFEISQDFLHSGRSYDVALIATLHNREDLDAYAVHPDHVPFKEHMAAISDSVVCCDFEI